MIAEVSTQLSEVVGVIERHLEPTLLAVHLYGSAVDGGLKPHSDIDLLVTVTVRLDETTRRALINDLLETSASPGESEILRAVEVTIVVHDDIIPWRYPAKRELQFGEWQRNDILAGIFEPATIDIDLAILLTKAREHSVALVGPAAEELFDPVPEQDLFEALNETLTLWNSPPDWAGDERNVVLTLSRIWYSAVTGKIAPKDVAADWAMERLPAQYQPVILEARQGLSWTRRRSLGLARRSVGRICSLRERRDHQGSRQIMSNSSVGRTIRLLAELLESCYDSNSIMR